MITEIDRRFQVSDFIGTFVDLGRRLLLPAVVDLNLQIFSQHEVLLLDGCPLLFLKALDFVDVPIQI